MAVGTTRSARTTLLTTPLAAELADTLLRVRRGL